MFALRFLARSICGADVQGEVGSEGPYLLSYSKSIGDSCDLSMTGERERARARARGEG